ncbi:MAG: choice-of-anchor D domain-containing protein, partial [Cyanophyceae cyanobacterium]
TVSGNSSNNSGGGIFGGTALTVTNSTLSGNSSNGSGGGLSAIAPITVTDSTISGNTATGGGGVDHLGLLTLTNSTLSSNSTSGDGGGIFSTDGGTNINNSTIVQNIAAGRGGGIFRNDGAIAIQNSIVAGNTNNGVVSPDVFGNAINGANNNIVGSTTGLASGSLGMGSDTTLGAAALSTVLNTTLTNNGGPTQTHALIDGGIAINGAGTGATTQDQRGFGLSGTRDIGAFELRNQEINVSGNSVAIANNDTTPDTADDTDFGGVNVNSGTITKTFTIENQGDLPLGFAGSPFATITGTNAEDFTITDLPIASLRGRSSITFQVTFDPSSVGTKIATVSFVTDDGDESPFTFAIQGEGTTGAVASSISAPPPLPGVAIAPPVVNPPKPIQGFSSALAQEPFTITNPNGTPLNLSAITLSENSIILSVLPTAATVNPGETATFTVQVADDVLPGTYGAIASIPSPTGAPITFNLSATVSLPTAFDVAPIFEAKLPSDTPIWTNGDDVLIGANIDGDGRQWLNGGPGNDQIFGNLDRDVLTGGTGDDSIFGGKGDDWIKGGEGNDVLAGDFGNDTLIGGVGNDSFIIGAGRGSDEILDFIDGVDGFLLEPTIAFEQLTFEETGNSTQIKLGDELLATVIGVGPSLLDGADFAPLT